ncbi:MAG: N-acetyltransferase family protein [Clostridia bacterium]|nr:N-acetyltransferase family protein [Clostridia bacterium]
MKIRRATEADYPFMRDIYAAYVNNTTATFEYDSPTKKQFTSRMKNLELDFPILVADDDGKIVGYVYAEKLFSREAYRWNAEISIYIAQGRTGQGTGRALESAESAILKALGFKRIYALITTENERSLAFHRARGYRDAAYFDAQGFKFGRTLSVNWLKKEVNGDEVYAKAPTRLAVFLATEEGRTKFQEILDSAFNA